MTVVGAAEDRVAVVTGSRRGLGAAIADVLAREGARVLVCSGSDPEAAAAVASELAQRRGVVTASFAGDLSDERAVDALVAKAERDLGPVDIVVNNAGGFLDPLTTLETERAAWDRMLAVNLTAPFLLVRRCLSGMVERGFGRVISIGSEVAVAPKLGNAVAYTAAKAGLIAFTKQVALEAAGSGVTANVLNPGTIATEHLQDVFDGSTVDAGALAATIPLGRFGAPEEVAGLVPYLVSEAAAYCTGAVFDVNGGRTMT